MKKCFPAFKAAIICIAVFSLTISGYASFGQSKIGQWYNESARSKTPTTVALFETMFIERPNPLVKNYLQLDGNEFASLLANRPALIDLYIPYDGKTVKLSLASVNTTSPGFNVMTDKGDVAYNAGMHYRGIVNDDPSTVAAVSIFDDNVMGFYSTNDGNFTIGKLEDGSGNYCIYAGKDLPSLSSFDCGAIEVNSAKAPGTGPQTLGIGCKTVTVYLECDYKFYQDKGSNTTTLANYVNGLFNQVSTLYANDNIDIQISQIFIWTSPDPYANLTSTNSVLTSFRANTGTNFNGDLAHFLTTRNLGGGIAYVDVVCYKSYAFGVSMVYNSFSTVPTYSWTVEVVTHELGHNLGSPHTQSCSWTGGAIDNCYTPEGSCAPGPTPINGGTIMSYCHLTSIGINFNNGFGPQPGNLIRSRVLNGSCLVSSGTAPAGLSTLNVTSTSADLTWVAVNGATQYTIEYKPSSSTTWTPAGSTTGTSLTINGLTSGASYQWHVKTDCSQYSSAAVFTTLAGAGCSTPTSLTTSNVTQSSASISWSPVSGATSYTVEHKLSTAATWNSTTTTGTSLGLSGLSAGTTYNWRVKADCSPLSAAVSFTTQNAPTGCVAPSNLSAINVTSSTATLTWAAVTGASSYTIKMRKVGTNKWSNYKNISTTFKNLNGLSGGSTYEWQISAKCSGGVTSNFSPVSTFTTPSNMGAIQEDLGDNIGLYPNPAGITLNVTLYSWTIDDAGTADVFNIQGSKIKSIPVSAGLNTIDLSNMADGMYLLSIKKDGAQTVTKKFMKSTK